MKQMLLLAGAAFLCVTAKAQTPTYRETYRPQFHFSPAVNWTNDPNGLVYYNGEYHLFYQHNPFENKWGHMTWGHAISKDLVHWQHLPIAIKEENGIMIFSGTCVVDNNNTSGFAKPGGPVPMVAIYTGHTDTNQSQHLAYSFNGGRTWKKYAHNPILDLHKKDFRDPKVFWYGPNQYWVMAVVLPQEHKVQFYKSKNLLSWSLLSEFGPAGDVDGIWECPDLFQVPLANNSAAKKWVLTMSISTTMQYFVGEFDGITFRSENPAGKIYRPDAGPDYYAGISYNQLPRQAKPVTIAWANNWQYANDIPTNPWKSAMTLPRELTLKKENNEWLLLQQPVPALSKLRGEVLVDQSVLVTDTKEYPTQSTQYDMLVEVQPEANSSCGVRVAAGNGHYAEIGYDAATQKLYIDRGHSSAQFLNKNFAKMYRYETPLALKNGILKLHILFDNSIVEVFANDGEAAMTMQIFPNENENGTTLFSNGGTATFNAVKIWKMNAAW